MLSSILYKHRKYSYLIGSVLCGITLLLLNTAPNLFSYVNPGNGIHTVCTGWSCFFIALSAIVLLFKLTHWRTFEKTMFYRSNITLVSNLLYFITLVIFAAAAFDRVCLGFASVWHSASIAETNPSGFLESMIYMLIKGKSMFLRGLQTTITIALIGTLAAFILGLLLVTIRVSMPARQDNDFVKFLKIIGNIFSKIYITVIRGTPMMVQAMIVYYAGFALFRSFMTDISEINAIWSAYVSGLLTVSLNSTAYIAEVFRGGINSIDKGQMEAARSLGLTYWQTMVKVIFPQATKNSIPSICNEFIINIKDSSVLSVISCFDLMFATSSVVGIYYKQLEVYCIAAIIYLILTCLGTQLVKFLSKYLETPSADLPSSN